MTKEIKKIRVFFPLLLRKDGKPRVRQKPVIVSLNGRTVYILRGVMSEVPQWVQDVCNHTSVPGFECFKSNQKGNQ